MALQPARKGLAIITVKDVWKNEKQKAFEVRWHV
jgi:hypothetical protein